MRVQVTYSREQLEILTEELREHRHLLVGLIERLPELEASTEPSGATEYLQAPKRSRGGPERGAQQASARCGRGLAERTEAVVAEGVR